MDSNAGNTTKGRSTDCNKAGGLTDVGRPSRPAGWTTLRVIRPIGRTDCHASAERRTAAQLLTAPAQPRCRATNACGPLQILFASREMRTPSGRASSLQPPSGAHDSVPQTPRRFTEPNWCRRSGGSRSPIKVPSPMPPAPANSPCPRRHAWQSKTGDGKASPGRSE